MAAAILRTSQDSSPRPVSTTLPIQSSGPSNEDIEAIIQMATSATNGRSPAPKDTRTQLFVGNLPYRVRWQDLKDLFRKAGTVLRADVSLGPDNRSRGYGTVLLATAEDAGRAVDMFNGYNWQTRTLEVRPDRIPPDYESPVPSNPTPNAGYHSPNSILTGGLSIPTLPPSLDDTGSNFSLSRPGTATENGSRNLFVGNLPFHCQWQDLKDLFRQAGTIVRADVALGPDGRSRGFGTVAFATEFDAERGVQMFNGYEFNGRQLKVHFDKFSPSQSSTIPTTPAPQMGFQIQPQFVGGFSNTPNHISIPFRYGDFGSSSGPSSPYDIYPPYLVMQQPVSMQHQASQSEHQKSPPLRESQIPSSNSEIRSSDTIGSTIANPSTPKGASLAQSSPSQNQHHHHHHPGRIALPPPSVGGFPPPHALSPHAISPLHHPMSHMHHSHIPVMTPHGLPPITPSMPSFTFLPQQSPSIHGPPHHGGPTTPGYEGATGSVAGHILAPYSFSPGLTMSPGAFWGRPVPSVNPYAAVGAPVHLQHTPYGMHPAAGSPVGFQREDSGGYFPPVPPQDYFQFAQPSSSGLANEIMPDVYSGTNTTGEPGSFKPEEPTVTPSPDSGTTRNGRFIDWHEGSSDDGEIEIVTGSLESLMFNHPMAPSTANFHEQQQQRIRSVGGDVTSLNDMLHRPGSDPSHILLDVSSSSPIPQQNPHGSGLEHRRASFAEIVLEGTSPMQRNVTGLGIRIPNRTQ